MPLHQFLPTPRHGLPRARSTSTFFAGDGAHRPRLLAGIRAVRILSALCLMIVILSLIVAVPVLADTPPSRVIIFDEDHIVLERKKATKAESDTLYRPGSYGQCIIDGTCPPPHAPAPSVSSFVFDWRNAEEYCDANQTCEKIDHRRPHVDRSVDPNETDVERRRLAVEQGFRQERSTTNKAQTLPDTPPQTRPPSSARWRSRRAGFRRFGAPLRRFLFSRPGSSPRVYSVLQLAKRRAGHNWK
jgi:hypothetical protein